ncbi:MAG: anthranilate phosphoribosyltransferase, partial [Acidimicrobiia bacterium]
LGVVVDLAPDGVTRCIEQAGIGFCFAPRFHPALRHAARARRELGVATTFNFLGPLVNPAGARRQALGVSDPAMAERLAQVLGRLGTERALVFFGHDGLDELTTTTTSTILELAAGEVRTSTFDPADLGLARAEPGSLVGGDPAHNAAVAIRVLDGEPGPVRDLVLLNAAAGITAAGLASDLASALEAARRSIDDGRAKASLAALVESSVEAARTPAEHP